MMTALLMLIFLRPNIQMSYSDWPRNVICYRSDAIIPPGCTGLIQYVEELRIIHKLQKISSLSQDVKNIKFLI